MRKSRDIDRHRRLLILRQQSAGPRAASAPGGPLPTEDFREACGLRSSLRVRVWNATSSELLEFHQPWLLIGRGQDCDVRIAEEEIPFRHTYVQALEDRLIWFPLQNGKEPVAPREIGVDGELVAGRSRIRIGVDEFAELSFDGTAADSVAAETLEESPPPALMFSNGSTRQTAKRLRHPINLLGRGRLCHVRLPHDSVSRVHCSLVRTRGGLWVVDLLGRGGTLVNRQAVRSAPLFEGDLLQVGRFQARVVLEHFPLPEPDAASPAPDDAAVALQLVRLQQQLLQGLARKLPSVKSADHAGDALRDLVQLNQELQRLADRIAAGHKLEPGALDEAEEWAARLLWELS